MGQHMLVIGGSDKDGSWLIKTYKYNGRTGKRTRCQDLPKPNRIFRSTVAVDSLVYALAHDIFLQYNAQADQWTKLPLLPPMECTHRCALVYTHGCLVALGGSSSDKYHPVDSVRSYNLFSRKWTLRRKKMPIAVSQPWAFTVLM